MAEIVQANRCPWCAQYGEHIRYHDEEWGVKVEDDLKWFEFLTLDAFQAGISWLTILRKREGFKRAFSGFDPELIAKYDEKKIQSLLADEKIIRNQLKIRATVSNAAAFLNLQEQHGSFNNYIWRFTEGSTLHHSFTHPGEVPVSTPLSDAISKDLKNNRFKFVGTTIIYAFMQAAGMVNDHLVSCYRYEQICQQCP